MYSMTTSFSTSGINGKAGMLARGSPRVIVRWRSRSSGRLPESVERNL